MKTKISYPPPYRPFRGAEPPHFVDREDPEDALASGVLATSIAAFASGPCDPRFHRLMIAGPAMGKTALMRAIGREAAGRLGWAVVFHGCRAKQRAIRAVSGAVMTALEQKWPGSVTRSYGPLGQAPDEGGRADDPAPVACFDDGASSWSALKSLLYAAGQLARCSSRGLLIMFDDADRLGGGELDSLGYLARSLSRDGLPVALMFSGGPELGQRFARAGHYAGSVWPSALDGLDDSDAREALVVPALDRGVEFEEEALSLLCEAAVGSPLELQRLGFAAWPTGAGSVVTFRGARTALDLLMEGARAS